MSTVDFRGLVWRKSSRSGGTGTNDNCVEIAFAGPVVAIRDSKNPTTFLSFPTRSFTTLTS